MEICKIVSTLNSRAAVGIDGVSTNFIKEHLNNLSVTIATLVNNIFDSKEFPSLFKTSKVVPIFKSGDKLDISNYRPISILPALSKIVEKILYQQIMDHLNSNNILSKHQYGFTKNSNTTAACLNLVSRISNGIDKKKICRYSISRFIKSI